MGKIEKINYSYQEDEVKFWNFFETFMYYFGETSTDINMLISQPHPFWLKAHVLAL